ncbi:ribosomal protein S5-alanine N-acetyltransferase [soil metagenome]
MKLWTDETLELPTERLMVRLLRRGDGEQFAQYYTKNHQFLKPWSPSFRPEMFSGKVWEQSIPAIIEQFRKGTSVRLGIFLQNDLIGVSNIVDLKGSPSYSGLLGYTLSSEHQGQGYMKEALTRVVRYLFETRNLHRIYANHMPSNERSAAVLKHLGFLTEGYSPDHLLIDGKWEDHVLTALTNKNWVSPD